MAIWEVIILALGLSMDAFAVSTTNGMNEKPLKYRKALLIAAFFGVFQGLMPLIGFYSGSIFSKYINAVDHWIAFILLSFIGVCMIVEAFKKEEKERSSLTIKVLFLQAIATSIDALAVGVSFAALQNVNLVLAISFITIITFVISFIGCFIGRKFGDLLNNKAQLVGGLILIGIGLKIFIEHMFLS